jgi:3-oxoacyl-[acyl-carrier-protein] synthase III
MSERDEIVHLIGAYETALNNAAIWRIDIKKLLENQKNQRFVQNIMERLVNATDNFRRSIEQ